MCHVPISVQWMDFIRLTLNVHVLCTACRGWNASHSNASNYLNIWTEAKTMRKDERKKWIIKRSFYEILNRHETHEIRHDVICLFYTSIVIYSISAGRRKKMMRRHTRIIKYQIVRLKYRRRKKQIAIQYHSSIWSLPISHSNGRPVVRPGRKLKDTRTLGSTINLAVHSSHSVYYHTHTHTQTRICISIAAMHAFCSRVGTQQPHKIHTYKCTKYMP